MLMSLKTKEFTCHELRVSLGLVHAIFMQSATMPTLQIRDLPDDVYLAVAVAAQAEHRSISQQAIMELRRALNVGTKNPSAAIVERLLISGRRLPASVMSPEAIQREERDGR